MILRIVNTLTIGDIRKHLSSYPPDMDDVPVVLRVHNSQKSTFEDRACGCMAMGFFKNSESDIEVLFFGDPMITEVITKKLNKDKE